MKRLLALAALLACGAFVLQDISSGHGGTYRGPGDTVPPGGGGGGGGGTPPGPTGGSPPGGSTPGPSHPGVPTGTGPVGTGTGAPARPTNPGTGAVPSAPDLSTWESWWGFNKDQYLQLKAAIYDPGFETGGFFGSDSKLARHTLKPSEETIRGKIVPALKAALAKERSNDIVTGALIALAKIGDVKNGDDGTSEFEPLILPFLKDANQEIAETSAVALGILANDRSVPTLCELASDSKEAREKLVMGTEVHYRTRAFATYGLGLIGHRTGRNDVRRAIAGKLVELISSPDSSTRDLKVAAVIALGLDPIDVDLSESLVANGDHSVSRQSQIKFLERVFADPQQHSMVRAHVPTALARLLPGVSDSVRDEVATILVAQIGPFSKERDEVQQSCVLALGMIGTTGPGKVDLEIRRALERIVKERILDTQSRNFCTIALAQIGGRGQSEGCTEVRDHLRDFLLAQMTQGPSHIKPWAGMALGVLERALVDLGNTTPPGAKETIRAAFKDARTPEQVGALAIGLGIARDVDAADSIRKKLETTSEAGVQGYLCVALGLIDARASIPDIRKIVVTSKYKPELLRQAAIGLGLLGDKALVDDLVTMLGQAQGLASQSAIASALGFIGDARSVDPLIAMLAGERGVGATARGFAAVALGIVGDKEMLPWNAKISTNINYVANTQTLTGEGTGILDIL